MKTKRLLNVSCKPNTCCIYFFSVNLIISSNIIEAGIKVDNDSEKLKEKEGSDFRQWMDHGR